MTTEESKKRPAEDDVAGEGEEPKRQKVEEGGSQEALAVGDKNEPATAAAAQEAAKNEAPAGPGPVEGTTPAEGVPAASVAPVAVEGGVQEPEAEATGKSVDKEMADVDEKPDGAGKSADVEMAGVDEKLDEVGKAAEGKLPEKGKAADQKAIVPRGPVSIGYKTFGMGTEASAYFHYLMNNQRHYQDLNAYEFHNVMSLLKQGHPTPAKKLGCGVRAVQVCPYRAPDGEESMCFW